jgi:hypothetical protein
MKSEVGAILDLLNDVEFAEEWGKISSWGAR